MSSAQLILLVLAYLVVGSLVSAVMSRIDDNVDHFTPTIAWPIFALAGVCKVMVGLWTVLIDLVFGER